MDRDDAVFICGYARTPVGSFQGSLSAFTAAELGALVLRAVTERAGAPAEMVDEVIMGCVLTGGQGQAPARQAALKAGLPATVGAVSVNKVCGSGLKSVALAAGLIRGGMGALYLAGGQESMSNAAYALGGARAGLRMGHAAFEDLMIKDGLWDVYHQRHMGFLAEHCARKYGFSRVLQDAFALRSYERAQAATAAGKFKAEIVAVEVQGKQGTLVFDEDEEPKRLVREKVATLRPVFQADGTITAVNASSVNDGAAAFVVASGAAVKAFGLTPIARIIGYGQGGEAPEWFTLAPVKAIRRALDSAGLPKEAVDLWEINEAFSVVTLAAMQAYDLAPEVVNVFGGACAIGHPIGASGARILCTLISALRESGKSIGLATLCIGGGEGNAMIIEMV